ncbi:MAG: aspartate ammonia-lyase [Pseudanabaenaceae cyanobacterium SKYGB_i_bin29]|nr:aspartate ammonia-lyase [Pseudanabaenaceae cyanobacterium SKYG29]MDW8422343.1 aspartate ammonia-lyase [Pseudanabaenaceae cyanobacterium SKYGB_i_bin29]
MPNYRTETDSMGSRSLPDSVYYGIQTVRALENFPISGIKPLPLFVDACVYIKKAAARVNGQLGCIPSELAATIERVCDEILGGQLRDQFVVDIYQAGAGTSHHMNINEVIANRALELLGEAKGNYKRVSPNDHVNYGQSTNDVIPTAIRLGALLSLDRFLYPGLAACISQLQQKGEEFATIVKAGRTHLQDAVPVRLGDEFSAYSVILAKHHDRVKQATTDLLEIGLGGSAAGTGLNNHPDYPRRVAEELGRLTGYPIRSADNLMAAMQSMSPFVSLAGALRNLAQDVSKIANDLRLMDSGPKTGLKEIQLPPVQPGSSIMPGKYNPVIAEMTNMVCFQVMGLDTAILLAAQAGQLELNVMMPLIAYDLLHMIQILGNCLQVLADRCIAGIEANPQRCLEYAEGTLSLVTALNPYLGYLQCASLAKESLQTGKSFRQLILEKQLLPAEQLEQVLDLLKMSRPHD